MNTSRLQSDPPPGLAVGGLRLLALAGWAVSVVAAPTVQARQDGSREPRSAPQRSAQIQEMRSQLREYHDNRMPRVLPAAAQGSDTRAVELQPGAGSRLSEAERGTLRRELRGLRAPSAP